MDEPSARRVLLAFAIETADREGKLLGEPERHQMDRDARQDAMRLSEGRGPIAAEEFLLLRAQRVLAAVGIRNPGIAALQEPGSWGRWVAVTAPLAALVMGVLTDAVGNPHRVDLVSLPLLGIVGWNLVMYIVIAMGALTSLRGGGRRHPLLADLGRWSDGERALRQRPGHLRAQVSALFHSRWFEATQALHLERVKRVLHLSAAAWGVGVALSLLVRGLVVEYRVGWESTFLGASQVHAILSILRLPALLLFPFEPFSVQEVASLQFSQGGGAVAGARWVYMYVALLLVVVIAPRLVLASVAWWRERMHSRRVAIDLTQPYYQRLLSLLDSARVQLCLVTHRAQDRAVLLRVLAQQSDALPVLASSEFGDVLRLVDVSGSRVPAASPGDTGPDWAQRLLSFLRGAPQPGPAAGDPVLTSARQESDVAVHVVGEGGDLEAGRLLLQWLNKPVLVLVNRPDGVEAAQPGLVAQVQLHTQGLGLPGEVLPFDNFARCWVQERELLDAMGRLLPQAKTAGFSRVAAAWEERNMQRLRRAMAVIADHLLYAARQVEDVQTGALTVKNLLPAERESQAAARQRAMDAIVNRLDASAAEMFARLRKLHGIDDDASSALEHHLEQKFVVQQAIDTPQAGIAGVATGAAMGATVDLLAGGLTLGAATALGALVGGGAAYVAAAWKNRASPSGGTIVQLSDAMMQAMTQAALLRYLAVVHCGRGAPGVQDEVRPLWKADVVGAVEAQKDLLPPFWSAARSQPNPARLTQPLAHDLETMVRKVLGALYPPVRPVRKGPGPDSTSAAI